MSWRDIHEETRQQIAAGQPVAVVAADLEERLRQGHGAFAEAAVSRFTNTEAEVRDWLTTMLGMLGEQIDVAFMYVEMNGFAINPDRWFCSPFGYPEPVPLGSPDDLAEFEAEVHFKHDLTLTGMEPMQVAYESRDGEDTLEVGLANALVQCRFADLMSRAVRGDFSVPVAVASHGSDLIVDVSTAP